MSLLETGKSFMQNAWVQQQIILICFQKVTKKENMLVCLHLWSSVKGPWHLAEMEWKWHNKINNEHPLMQTHPVVAHVCDGMYITQRCSQVFNLESESSLKSWTWSQSQVSFLLMFYLCSKSDLPWHMRKEPCVTDITKHANKVFFLMRSGIFN